MQILLAVLLGSLFGFALYYAGAAKFSNLTDMLSLRDLSLMKIILFAIGFASALLSISSLIGIFDVGHLSVKTTHLGVVLGGLIFGIGFGWAGTCPGTCAASLTSGGLKKAAAVIIGGLIGAFVFSLSYGSIADSGILDAMNLGKLTLFKLSDEFPSVIQIGFEGLLVLGIVFMIAAVVMPVSFSKRSEQ